VNFGFGVDAEYEYLEAVRFLEEKRSGLGAALIDEFERVMVMAVARPDAWRLVHPTGIRRIGLARFPYAVFYRVAPSGQIQVTAFAHHRRRPAYWLGRL